MKTKLLTTNVGVASAATFSGLIVILSCAILFQQNAILPYIVAFIISVWGLLSLKQRIPSQPEKQGWQEIGFTTALIVFIGGGLLFGTIKMLDATQTKVSDCVEQTRAECNEDIQEPPCPEPKRLCSLDVVE
ncbi:MAG: hypothetical protein OXM61_07430 [Candidatus Poribacteria bacterium]|nr:hypothetical protein [Candidatus Poribacteria bacterium]